MLHWRAVRYGKGHPEFATAISWLGIILQRLGRYAEAEPLMKRALAIDEKALGQDHPYVGAHLDNLALLYEDQGRYAEAEPLFKRALANDEKKDSRCSDLKVAYGAPDYRRGELLPFDLARAHELYKALFGQIEDLIKDKQLLIVPSGPLTQLPFQVLVIEP